MEASARRRRRRSLWTMGKRLVRRGHPFRVSRKGGAQSRALIQAV